MILRQFDGAPPAPASDRLPLPGGDIENFAAFESDACRELPNGISRSSMQALLRNHGTDYRALLNESSNSTVVNVSSTHTLTAEVRYAVSHEMAVHLDDVVMRRTDLAAGSHPGRVALQASAAEMGRQLAWSAEQLHREIAATERNLQRHLARDSSSNAASLALSNIGAPHSIDATASAASPARSDGAMLAETTVRASA
jgi:glycerol-3-phosphate dehydrogenase